MDTAINNPSTSCVKKRKFGDTNIMEGREDMKKSKVSISKQTNLKPYLDEFNKNAQISEGSEISAGNVTTQSTHTEKLKITDFFRAPPASSLGASPMKTQSSSIAQALEKQPVMTISSKPPSVPKHISKVLQQSRELGSVFEYSDEEQAAHFNEIKHKIKEKDNMISTLTNQLQNCQQNFEKYTTKVQAFISRKLLEVEELKREKNKAYLNHQRQRLGEYTSQRNGTKFSDSWIDGAEVRAIKEKISLVQYERDQLEKKSKSIKNRKSSVAKNSTHDDQEESKNATTNPNLMNNFLLNLDVQLDNMDLNFNVENTQELKERITSRILLLGREEAILKEKLERLQHEIFVFMQEYKKQHEEDNCRFAKENKETNTAPWPILITRYQFLSLLGKGGFSEVYKAYDLEEMREVACKIHQINNSWTEAYKANYVKHALRENNAQTGMKHPNIVELHDTVEIDKNSFCTVLEYCEGPDLSQYLKRHKCIPEKEAKTILRQVVNGLKYLYDRKPRIIHFDLKPQNIIFHHGEVKISDFGLCKILDSNESRCELTSQGVGTYWYLPPETFLVGDSAPSISSKVDVWALGVIFYEMLYGQKPFGHNMSQDKILKEGVILKSVRVTFPPKAGISQEAKDLITKCLAYSEIDRYDVEQVYHASYFNKK